MSKIGAVTAGAAGALLAGSVYSFARIRYAARRYPPEGDFVSVGGVRLHYVSSGRGQPVVLLHGSGLAHQDLADIAARTAAAGFRAISFDRPGYGDSDWPPAENLTLDLNAHLLHEALKQLGISQPLLVGHSSGGAVALDYAVNYPGEAAGLLLLAPSAYAEGLSVPNMYHLTETPLLSPLFLNVLYVPLVDLFGPVLLAGMFAPNDPPPGYLDRIKPVLLRPRQIAAWANELRHLRTGLARQSRRYGEIRIPVRILAGANDPFDPPTRQASRLRLAIPGARLTVLEVTGHTLHQRYPERVIDALCETAYAGASRHG
jgi:pimeloyl-ACP methyl ester carboxylesterase